MVCIKAQLGKYRYLGSCPPVSLMTKTFRRLHYPADIIALCARLYLAYVLSLRNLEELMGERGICVKHSTLHRWVIREVPLLDRPVGYRWRMDETYIRVREQGNICTLRSILKVRPSTFC
jgi:putative transposase